MKKRLLVLKIFIYLSLLLIVVVLFLFPDHSYAAGTTTMEPIWSVLKNYSNAATLGGKVYGIWNTFIKLTNGFVVVVLIVVAFAQILRLNLNTYGVKKALPTLVLAIIAANFSFLFCRLLIDFSSVIISLFLQGSGGTSTNATNVVSALSNITNNISDIAGKPCQGKELGGAACYTFGTLFWHGIANLMIMAGGIVILILAYLFIVRNWLLYFLVSLAPLAFMSLVLPQTKSLFNQWWTNFAKWVFMPVVSVFWIWVGSLWFDNIGSAGTLMSFIFAGVCFYLALTTPFKMGGAVMGTWGKIGKTVWGKTGGFALGQAKWAAGGGIASTMSLRNQLKAKQLRAEGKNKEAEKYEKGANRWAWVNPGAIQAGLKGRIDTRRAAIEGAPKKTQFYNRLLGAGATIRAGVDANKDDWGVMSPEQVGSSVKKLLNDSKTGVWDKLSTGMRDRFMNEAINPDNQAEMRTLGYTAGQETEYAQHRFLQFLAKENPDALGNEINVGSGEYFGLGNLKGGAQEYIRMMRGNPSVRDRAHDSFVASSAVGAPGSPGSSNAADVEELENIAGDKTAQKLIESATNQIPYQEALDDNGALRVIIANFDDPAQQALHRAYNRIQSGANNKEGQEFLNEAGKKSENTAKIAGLIGSKEGADKISAMANHSDLSFEEALKSSGVDTSTLTDGAKQVLQETYESIQKSKNDMVKEVFSKSENEIDEEIQGMQLVINGVNKGVRLGSMKSKLGQAQQMYEEGNISGSKSVLVGISGPILDPNIEQGIQKRMKHLSQGIEHFSNFDKQFASIADPGERRAAINKSQARLQNDSGGYVAEVKERKKAEAMVHAEASTATHIAASNLVANPAVRNLPVTQMATNPVAMQELTSAISGLHGAIESHGEQVEHATSQAQSGSVLNQVTKVDPISMGAKQMVVNTLNDSIQKGMIGAGTTIAQAFSSKAFRQNIALGMGDAMKKTGGAVKSPSATRPSAQTTPQTPPVQNAPFKMPPDIK